MAPIERILRTAYRVRVGLAAGAIVGLAVYWGYAPPALAPWGVAGLAFVAGFYAGVGLSCQAGGSSQGTTPPGHTEEHDHG